MDNRAPSPHDEPESQGPKMPPSIPPDEFFNKMTETARLEHLQDSLYQAALIRREYRQSGAKERVTIQSNYKRLLQMIDPSTAPTKGTAGGPAIPGAPSMSMGIKVGSIMSAIKSATSSSGGNFPINPDDEGYFQPTAADLQRSDESVYTKLKKDVYGRDPGPAIAVRAVGTFGDQLSRDVVDRARQAMTTITRQKVVEEHEFSDASAKSLRETLKAAAVNVRKKFLRCSSYPRAMYSVAAYADYKEKYDKERLENKRLRKVCDGLEPRDQENVLKAKIDAQEQQIINQLALIKGLREKIKVFKEQSSTVVVTPAAAPLAISQSSATYSPVVVSQPTVVEVPSVFANVSPPVSSRSLTPPELLLKENSATMVGNGSLTAVPSGSVTSLSLHRQRMGSTLRMLSTAPQGPRGENCAIVVVDLDSAKFLWETFPDTMKTQTEILHRILRQELTKWRGYEALNRDDKFMIAFTNCFDACQFSLQVQLSLVNCAEWSSVLSETPETANDFVKGSSTQFLWRGLRIRCAIDVGAQAIIDPIFPNRISYEGAAVETADYLHKLAVGGEILISHSVAEAIHDQLDKLGNPFFEDWGTVTYHPCRVGVRRIISKILDGRRVNFNRALSTAERTLHEESEDPDQLSHPPKGKVTMVTVLCPSMPLVKQYCSEYAYKDTMQRAFHCVSALARSEGAYVSQMNLDALAMVLAFEDTYGAIKFSLALQQALLDQDWSKELARIPQCSPVYIREKVIFTGLRAQIGVYRLTQAAVTFREPMEGKILYRAKDAKISSLMAAAAVDGEVVIADSLVSYITQNYDDLDCPVSDYVGSIPTPVSDTLLRLYQVFSGPLSERAAFVNRECRLSDENSELANNDIINTFRKQVGDLQKKLEEKNEWIKRLYLHLDQKTEEIGTIRKFVLREPFFDIDVGQIVGDLDRGFTFPNEVVLVAFSFANVEELYDHDAVLMPDALDLYDSYMDRTLKMFEGREVRRLPSRIARIVAFPDAFRAMACWIHILKTSSDEEWPARLDDTTGAGLVMASEFFPGIQPDAVVWKGLRPTCAMHSAMSQTRFNTLTKAYEVIGDDVNTLAEMLRCAGPGDALVSSRFALLYKDKLERGNNDLQFSEYGPFIRGVDTSQRYRVRALNQSFPPIQVNDLPKPRQLSAMIVHVMIQDTYPNIFEEFPMDVKTFNERVLSVITEYHGTVMSSLESEYVAIFENPDDGCRFAVHIHDELLVSRWTKEIQRVMDFRELVFEGKPIVRGIRAKVGCHYLADVNEILDLFSGREQWFHPQFSLAFALALTAHSGETVATQAAREFFRSGYAAKKVDYFVEPCGTVRLDLLSRKDAIYQLFPVQLKARVAYFIEEDKKLNDPESAALRKKMERVFRKKHDKYADLIRKDQEFLDVCERNTNPFDDPIHRKTHKLFQQIRPQLDEERSRFLTCQETLSLIETVSMMAEDQLFLGDPDDGAPYYAHLMLHQLENGRVCKDIFYNKDLGSKLLGNVLLVEAPKTVELDAAKEGEVEVAQLNGSLAGSMIAPPLTSPVRQLRSGSAVASGNFPSSPHVDGPVHWDAVMRNASITSAAAHTSSTPQQPTAAVAIRKTTFSTNLSSIVIHPEDVVQLHIDVERFYQLLKLHGLDNPIGFAIDYMEHAYAVCFPGRDPGELDDSVRWSRITALASVIGMDVGSVDIQKLRCSIVAYLALAYQEIATIEW